MLDKVTIVRPAIESIIPTVHLQICSTTGKGIVIFSDGNKSDQVSLAVYNLLQELTTSQPERPLRDDNWVKRKWKKIVPLLTVPWGNFNKSRQHPGGADSQHNNSHADRTIPTEPFGSLQCNKCADLLLRGF